MTLSEICVRRPVFATMLVSACVAFGALSFGELGVDQYPDVEVPTVTVQTTLRGASPEEIETQVTKIIEDAVSTAEGIDEMSSTSLEGISIVTINFVLERDRDQATQDVRDKVAAALSQLPEGTDPPVVTRFDTTAIPVGTLVVAGDRDLREITDIAENRIMEPLQGLSGVGEIQLVGGRRRAFQVEVDARALAVHRLPIEQVVAALQAQNVEVPGGRMARDGREDAIRTVARARDVAELRALPIVARPDAPVLLGDIATVTDAEEEPRSLSRLDGRNAVALVVQKQSGSNTVEVVDNLNARLAELRPSLPDDIRITMVRDSSRFIRRSIHEVEVHLVLGGILASLSVLFFMGSVRSTLIAAIAIPSSIVTTFTILRVLDYTLNNFTLLALTLAVGIVIDDAIVVLENVYRHIERGADPFKAAIEGTKEITLAVFATTLSLVVIFLPTAYMPGRVGRFFSSFGVTTAVAIMVSLFVSLTLTPMLCSRFLEPPKHDAHTKKNVVARFNDWLDASYGRLVGLSLRARWLIVLLAFVCIAAVVPLFKQIGTDFLPQDDTSEFTVALTMPEGSDLETVAEATEAIEAEVRRLRGVRSIFTRIGASRGEDVTEVELFVMMIDIEQRDYSQQDVMRDARAMLTRYSDLRPVVGSMSGLSGGGRNSELSFSIRGPDLAVLDQLTADVMDRMRAEGSFVDVDSANLVRTPEIRVVVDRRRAADLGVMAGDLASAMRVMVGGQEVSKLRVGDEQYDVWVRLRPEDRSSEQVLAALPIGARDGLTRLDAVATLDRERGPSRINRLGRIRKVDVGANLRGVPLGTAVERVRAIAAEMNLPPGYEFVFGGRAKILAETIQGFLLALGLSLLFMYMVLAAQFESFLHPITILLSLPLSLPFALASLILFEDTLNIYSAFGIFMLFGIVKKNGILQVDYTNVLRAEGMPRDEAIIRANATRLRPILMTTLTLIAGMIPLALGKGPGAATRASMAKVIIGGQAMSLLITLLIVPVAYSLFDDAGRLFEKARARFSRTPVALPPAPEPERAE